MILPLKSKYQLFLFHHSYLMQHNFKTIPYMNLRTKANIANTKECFESKSR
jgi:hypothetical protein